MSKRINLPDLNRDDFNVTLRGDKWLVVPSKAKHKWAPEEMHLRSLLLTQGGTVVSSGWHKALNYGEDKTIDEQFRKALARNAVIFTEKMDGTLIILSFVDGRPLLRTRGNDTLGEFEEPVLKLLNDKYPRFWHWYLNGAVLATVTREHFSLLFEYTGPENRIVIPYDESALTFLGAVSHTDLTQTWDRFTAQMIEMQTGIPAVREIDLPRSVDDLMPIVRAWTDKEGVVARFVTEDGVPTQVKIKASQYVKLHAIKFKLNEANVAKLLFLLGAKTADEAREKLFAMNIDAEAQEFIQSWIDSYVAVYRRTVKAFDYFVQMIDLSAGMVHVSFPETGTLVRRGDKQHRKTFVEHTRQWIDIREEYDQDWFPAAMAIYDGKIDDARLAIMAKKVFGESPNMLRNWLSNSTLEVESMLYTGGDD
jgi:hypothetical protein